MTRSGRPVGGVMDRALSRIGDRPRLIPRFDVSGVLRTRTRGGLQTGVAQRRPGRGTAPHRQLPDQGDRGRRCLGDPGQRPRRSHPGFLQRLPAPGKQAGMERLSRRGDPRDMPAIHLQVPRMALRPRRRPEIRAAGIGVLRPRHRRIRVAPGALRCVERLHLHQLRRRAAAEPARVPGPDDHRPGWLPVRQADRTLRVGRAQQQQLENLRRRVPGVLPRALAALPAGAVGGARTQRRIHLRALPTRRSAPAGVDSGTAPLAAGPGVHVSDRAGHQSGLVGPWRTPDIGELPPPGSIRAVSSRGGSATSRSSPTSRS